MLEAKVTANGFKFYCEEGHTEEEWNNLYEEDDNLWSFDWEELLDGTIEPSSDIVYWHIGDRYYETDIEVA